MTFLDQKISFFQSSPYVDFEDFRKLVYTWYLLVSNTYTTY